MFHIFRASTSSKTLKLKTLYNVIRKFSPVTSDVLYEETGYKPATCARLLDELVKSGLVQESGLGQSTGGRKPIMYQINPTAFYLIGIEYTRLYTTILLQDLQLTIVDVVKIKMGSGRGFIDTLQEVVAAIANLLGQYDISERLLGIGIAITDLLDRQAGADLEAQIKAFVTKRFQTCVLIDCGVNFAALAEYRSNYWTTTKHLLFTSCDIEIRSSFILDGKLVFADREMTDGFGHMVVDAAGKRCSCGWYGCLHSYSSLAAIRQEVLSLLKSGQTSAVLSEHGDIDTIDFHHILQAIECNDPLCTSVVERAAYYYGIGLSNLIFTLKPEVVVCGGTLVPKSVFFEVARKTALNRLRMYPNFQVQIRAASKSYHIVAQGAGCMVLEHYLQ